MSLETLPLELVIDSILLAQSNRDLSQLRLVSRTLLRLADDASLWRRRVARDFKLPAYLASRVVDWRALYVGLTQPEAWTCGKNTHARLGVDMLSMPPQLQRVIGWNRGAPFPLKVAWKEADEWRDGRSDDHYIYWTVEHEMERQGSGGEEVEDVEEDSESGHEEQGSDKQEDGQDEDEGEVEERRMEPLKRFENEVEARDSAAEEEGSEASDSYAPLDLGVPVELHAAGWMHCALTNTGCIIGWGQLREQTRQGMNWWAPALVPSIVDLGPHKAKAMTCGETLVVLTQDELVYQWGHMQNPVHLLDLFGLEEDERNFARRITQLTSGGQFTTILTSAPASGGEGQVDTGVYLWFNQWCRFGIPEEYDDMNAWQEEPEGSFTRYARSTHSVRLPELPAPPTDLATSLLPGESDAASHPSHQRIVRLAAGNEVIYALSASGLLYKMHVTQPLPPISSEWSTEEYLFVQNIEKSRSMMLSQMESGQCSWVLLRGHCDPAMIESTGNDVWGLPDKQGLVGPSLRITNISATLTSFVAYGCTAAFSSDASRGIVLLGSSSASTDTQPCILPWLQGTGIVKVECGERHWGALDARGKLRTWGSWAWGARGTWDSCEPTDTDGAAPELTAEGLIKRLAAGYRGVARALRRVQKATQAVKQKSTFTKADQAMLERRCAFRKPPRDEQEPQSVKFFDLVEQPETSEDRFLLDFAMNSECTCLPDPWILAHRSLPSHAQLGIPER